MWESERLGVDVPFTLEAVVESEGLEKVGLATAIGARLGYMRIERLTRKKYSKLPYLSRTGGDFN